MFFTLLTAGLTGRSSRPSTNSGGVGAASSAADARPGRALGPALAWGAKAGVGELHVLARPHLHVIRPADANEVVEAYPVLEAVKPEYRESFSSRN